MNYYLVQTKYFLVFIIFGTFTLSAMPFVDSAVADISDYYIKSQMKNLQGEMLFLNARSTSLDGQCYQGRIGELVQSLIQEYGKKVVCTTNKPEANHLLVYVELRSGLYYAIDSTGVSCELSIEPQNKYRCKDSF